MMMMIRGEGLMRGGRKPEANKSEMKEAIDFFGRTIVVIVTSEDIGTSPSLLSLSRSTVLTGCGV